MVKANEADFQPMVANLRQVARKLDEAIDQAALKTGIDRFSSAAARLDSGIARSTRFSRISAPQSITGRQLTWARLSAGSTSWLPISSS